MSQWKYLSIALLAVLVLALGYVATQVLGGFDVGADTPHGALAFWFADTTRANAIAAHAREVARPHGFGSDAQLKEGASEYAEMCAQCHLAPGMEPTEISQGLYPRPPELAQAGNQTPEQKYWVITHGIKMTGMSACKKTHNNTNKKKNKTKQQKQPKQTPDDYRTLTFDAAEDHDAMGHMPGMEK